MVYRHREQGIPQAGGKTGIQRARGDYLSDNVIQAAKDAPDEEVAAFREKGIEVLIVENEPLLSALAVLCKGVSVIKEP